MQEFVPLTKEDYEFLRKFIHEQRKDRVNADQQATTLSNRAKTPDVYVINNPGFPSLRLAYNTGTGTASYDVPGSNTASIYRLQQINNLYGLSLIQKNITVYNVSTTAILASNPKYLIAWRNKFGQWIVEDIPSWSGCKGILYPSITYINNLTIKDGQYLYANYQTATITLNNFGVPVFCVKNLPTQFVGCVPCAGTGSTASPCMCVDWPIMNLTISGFPACMSGVNGVYVLYNTCIYYGVCGLNAWQACGTTTVCGTLYCWYASVNCANGLSGNYVGGVQFVNPNNPSDYFNVPFNSGGGISPCPPTSLGWNGNLFASASCCANQDTSYPITTTITQGSGGGASGGGTGACSPICSQTFSPPTVPIPPPPHTGTGGGGTCCGSPSTLTGVVSNLLYFSNPPNPACGTGACSGISNGTVFTFRTTSGGGANTVWTSNQDVCTGSGTGLQISCVGGSNWSVSNGTTVSVSCSGGTNLTSVFNISNYPTNVPGCTISFTLTVTNP